FRNPEHGEFGADLVEGRDDLARRGQQEELARIRVLTGAACTVLQQRRCRITIGIDLHGVESDAGGVYVVTRHLLTRVDLRRIAAVGDAAVPGIVVVRRPGAAAGAFGVTKTPAPAPAPAAPAASAVVGVPIGPVDPVLGMVYRVDVDVLDERNDRNVDVAVLR